MKQPLPITGRYPDKLLQALGLALLIITLVFLLAAGSAAQTLAANDSTASGLKPNQNSDRLCNQQIASALTLLGADRDNSDDNNNNNDNNNDNNNSTRWQQAERQLNLYYQSCLHSSHFLALLGSAQLHTGQPDRAKDTLERALLLNPRHGRARIDYAHVLFLLGQPFAALQLNQQLLDATDLPDIARAPLQQRHQRWQQRLQKRSLNLSLALGYDDNLNTSANLASLELTPGEGPILQLPLSPDSRPTEAIVLDANLNARWQTLTPGGVNQWQLGLQSQHSEYPYDQQQFSLSYGQMTRHPSLQQILSRETAQSPYSQWQLGLLHTRYNNQPLYQGAELELSGHRPLSQHCQLHLPFTLTGQYFPTYSRQHALLAQLRPAISCYLGGGFQWATRLDLGYNHALADRSGGDRIYLGLFSQLQWQQHNQRWFLSLSQRNTEDETGYSPLLSYNARRSSRLQQAVLGYTQAISPGLSVNLRLQAQRNLSNIPLFRYQRHQAQLGFSLRLP